MDDDERWVMLDQVAEQIGVEPAYLLGLDAAGLMALAGPVLRPENPEPDPTPIQVTRRAPPLATVEVRA